MRFLRLDISVSEQVAPRISAISKHKVGQQSRIGSVPGMPGSHIARQQENEERPQLWFRLKCNEALRFPFYSSLAAQLSPGMTKGPTASLYPPVRTSTWVILWTIALVSRLAAALLLPNA